MQKYRLHIASLFLLAFMALQLGALHRFAHDDVSKDCKVCLIVHHSQSLHYTGPALVQTIETPHFEIKNEIQEEYAFAKAVSPAFQHLSRPPPFNC